MVGIETMKQCSLRLLKISCKWTGKGGIGYTKKVTKMDPLGRLVGSRLRAGNLDPCSLGCPQSGYAMLPGRTSGGSNQGCLHL